jgi:SulP family sulfate permease
MRRAAPTQKGAWPIFRALRGTTPGDLGHDLAAGLTLAAIAVPEQMATARLGGFAPQVGLFAFAAAAVGFAAFGASRRLSAGADSTITPIFAGSLALLAATGSPKYLALAAALALLVGVMLIVGGLLKLGWVADLLSQPVTTGFLAGISLHIVLSQAPSVLGVAEGSGDVYHRLAALSSQMGAINPVAVAMGLGVFAAMVGAEAINARIPGALIALVGATAATIALRLDRRGLATLGQIPEGLPHVVLPRLGFETVVPLVGLAFVISLVIMVQTAATTRSFSDGQGDPDVDRDFIGVGAAGVLAGLVGAFPVNASPPRTAIVAETGGRSQWAGLLAAAVVLLLAALGTGLLVHVPTAALAGVLLFVAQRIFHVGAFAEVARRSPAEFALGLLTMALVFVLPIQTGVAIAIVLSLVHGVFTITRTRPIPFERVAGSTVWWPASTTRRGETSPGAIVMGFQAPLSFLNAHDFRSGLMDVISRRADATRLIVLEASSIVEIDFTASTMLNAVIDAAHAAGLDFAVARLESVRAMAAFERFGVTQHLGPRRIFDSVEQAIQTLAGDRSKTR